jgi:hypothetical protein
MIDILKFMYPNNSPAELAQLSNFCFVLGWITVCVGILGFIVESIGQKRAFWEAGPFILMGFFFIITLEMHSDGNIFSFLYNT